MRLNSEIYQDLKTTVLSLNDVFAENKLLGNMVSSRMVSLQNMDEDFLYLDRLLFQDIAFEIYRVSIGTEGFVLTYGRDSQCLWLDNHFDDKDFTAFCHDESLFSWLSDRVDVLAEVLTATKFAFLLEPRLIRKASDIPVYSEKRLAEVMSYVPIETRDEFLRDLNESKDRLEVVSRNVVAPRVHFTSPVEAILTFNVWTRRQGLVIELVCSMDNYCNFSYEASILAKHVGLFRTQS